MNSLNDNLERVVKTRDWIFYTAQNNVFLPKKDDSHPELPKQNLGCHCLPFTFDLPLQDLSAELNCHIIAHTTPNWRKPANLPPTCKIEDPNDISHVSSAGAFSNTSSIKKMFNVTKKLNRCDISYSIVVDVQWQRNVMQSNKAQ
jgi:hypothetical protein